MVFVFLAAFFFLGLVALLLWFLERLLEDVPGGLDGCGPHSAEDVLDKVEELLPLPRDVLVLHHRVHDPPDVGGDGALGGEVGHEALQVGDPRGLLAFTLETKWTHLISR